MKKLMLTAVAVGLAMVMVTDASAEIFRRRRRVAPVYVPPVAAATAQMNQGHRTLSHEPITPAVRQQVHGRVTGEHAYEKAIDKSLERGF